MKIEIRLGEEFKFFNGQPEKVTRSFLNLSEEALTTEVKDETPVQRGKLRNSWTPKLYPDRLVVSNSREYAVFVEKGTGIFGPRRHRIFSRNGGPMRAIIDKEEVYFTNHRGQPGQHMAEKGFMNYRKRIPNLFRTAVYTNTRKSGGK
ncbi:hypothetical protein PXD04_10385 [Methanosphaera sp. ISO3-F5]|uniref:HK97 gp10 family phage protein n=1 Tax=Methanosphaera sp. ISO3-F5 TaxID=1452353 RepID=UPI002B25F24E|nr:hypothetical protein [Methanosphaera sp. ISO3-F5]WQH64098.1 hypothetical protein PXD04_10385 [Methanosphaera sp. ISO3-F5]